MSTVSSPTPNSTSFRPSSGEVVHVRTAHEIFETLDETGCLNGLPFMPEMLPFCGRKFRIQRVANKACVNSDSVFIGAMTNAYVLAIPQRCDGSAHGGCQMGCKFLWRSQWLTGEPTECDLRSGKSTDQIERRLRGLAIKSKDCFRCQATDLVNIASPKSAFHIGQYVKDVASGVPLNQVIRFVTDLAIKKANGRTSHLGGPCNGKTPAERLDLKVGERARVKPLEEIRETLNANGKNRGLWFDKEEMEVFCGKELVVSRVLDRLIDEKNGMLRELKQPCIVLSETECSGVFRRFCSRGMLHFWREVWLERVS